MFSGFIAAWFLAASPIRRSSLVKETNEGVVKLPCSLATARTLGNGFRGGAVARSRRRTDFDIGALVVGDTGIGRAWRCVLANFAAGKGLPEMRTKIDANGTLIDFVAHGEDVYVVF